MYRKTYLEVNLDRIYHNIELLEKHTNKKLIAVVKANAYGMIDYALALKLEEKGVELFAVSSLEEAIRLREHGINSYILVMGYVSDMSVVKKLDLAIIVPSIDWLNKYKDELSGIKVHIKVNTGLNRLGVFPNETKEALDILLNKGAIVDGIMTHFACDSDQDYSYRQYYLFKETVESLNYNFKYIHGCATDVALYIDDQISNYIRIGIGLFGYANIEHTLNLKPAVRLFAEVVYSKIVKEGDGVSYDHHYISDGKGYINTIAIGYADGIPREFENKEVLIGNEVGTIVGTVCMDLLCVKSNHKHEAGEIVEIYGDNYNFVRRKKELNTCICKLFTEISERVPRVYIENDKVVEEIKQRK